MIPDAAARAVAFETGKVDILPGGSVENFDVPRLSKAKGACMTTKGWEFFGPLSWLWLNNRQGPTANKAFRQAVMYALDRDISRVTWCGTASASRGRPVLVLNPVLQRQAGEVFLRSGQGQGAREGIRLQGRDRAPAAAAYYGETWQRWAEAVKQNLEDVGIKVELVATDVPGWNQKTSEWGLRHRLQLPVPIRRPGAGGRPQLRVVADQQGLAVQQTSRATRTRRSTRTSPRARSRSATPSARRSTTGCRRP